MHEAGDPSRSELQLAADRERTEAAIKAITEFEREVRDRYAAALEEVRDEPLSGPEADARRPALVEAGRDLLPHIEERLAFLREAPDFASMAAEIHLNHTDSPGRAAELALLTESVAACAGALEALLRLLWELQHRTSQPTSDD